jgi:hypothetical protein
VIVTAVPELNCGNATQTKIRKTNEIFFKLNNFLKMFLADKDKKL